MLVSPSTPGNQPYLGRVWLYDIASDTLTQLAEHDPARFASPNPALRQDEESSGVIDVSDILGAGWYLLDVQAHYPNDDPSSSKEASSSPCTSRRARSLRGCPAGQA